MFKMKILQFCACIFLFQTAFFFKIEPKKITLLRKQTELKYKNIVKIGTRLVFIT